MTTPQTVEEIMHKHKANIYVKLEPGSTYSDYYAHIEFKDNKIKVKIYNDEGGCYDGDDEAMPFEWIATIKGIVDDLKNAKAIPDYTLELPGV